LKILVADIGNSKCKTAIWDGRRLYSRKVIPTRVIDRNSFSKGIPVAASCVVPSVRKILKGSDILWIDAFLDTGVNFSLIDMRGIGSDRVAAAAAVARFARKSSIIVDAGTAVTVDALSENKVFLGGAIMPGLRMMKDSLHRKTAGLPLIKNNFSVPPVFAGKNTVEAIRAGTELGFVGSIEYLIKGIAGKCDFRKFDVFVSGGEAARILSYFPKYIYFADIVLLGVATIWEREKL